MAEKPYKNKYFSVLGDSISTLAGYNPPECGVFYDWRVKRQAGILAPEDTWWGRVIDELGGQLLVNHSWAGSTVCRLTGCEVESYGCSHSRGTSLAAEGRVPDVVMIFMGINDLGHGVPLESAGEGCGTFPEAYDLMLQNIRRHYPQAEIWCLELPNLPGIGSRAEAYNRAIRACTVQNGCRLVEIYRPDSTCDTLDGYHPTARGMETLAQLVRSAITA